MAPTADQLIAFARTQLGYTEYGGAGGNTGNDTKYWVELDPPLQGESWCAVFVSWVFKHAGCPLPPIDRPYGFMNVSSAINWAKANGYFDASGHYAPGDIVLFGNGQHTGIVISDDGVNLHTIEGNAQPGNAGDQTNGGAVWERVRPHGPWVTGVLKSSRWLAKPSIVQRVINVLRPSRGVVRVPLSVVQGNYPLPRGQWFGVDDHTVRTHSGLQAHDRPFVVEIQKEVGAVPDGAYGRNTAAKVSGWQHAHGIYADGAVGPVTWRAMGGA